MGRVKLKIKKLENNSGRQITYSKRRSGILKKAKELSILCDIDLILIMFSPTDKPTVCIGDKSTIEEVIEKYAALTPQERTKRKLESLEALKKTFKKLDHDVNIQDFLGSGGQTVEDLTSDLASLKSHLEGVQNRLSFWCPPENVDNFDHIRAMEQSLKESLNRIQIHKENFAKQHLIGLQCVAAAQFQAEMQLPLGLSGDPSSSWFLNTAGADGHQPMMLSDDPTGLLHPSNMGCSASASLQSYPSFFGMSKPPTDAGGCSEHGQPVAAEFGQAECLDPLQQLAFQYPPPAFDHTSLLNEGMFRPDAVDDGAAIGFGAGDAHFGLGRSGDDAGFQSWASAPASCSSSVFDHHQQQHHQQQQPSSAQLPAATALAAAPFDHAVVYHDPSQHQQVMI